MQELAPQEAEASRQSRAIPGSPLECDSYGNACFNLFAAVGNMFLLYSPRGLEKWQQKNRDYLMKVAIKHFDENKAAINYEREKV